MQMNQEQASKQKEDQTETNSADQERVFKKPDKILPCPRCNSLDTKFCYFNNYNVNQPRHFCKNCQRYWTAGGTMRNVPVGAGRRKNKQFASQYRQILVSSDGVPISRLENTESPNHQLLPSGDSAAAFRPSMGNGTVLKFGPEAPLCESMDSVLNLGEHKRSIEMSSVNCGENGREPSSCGSPLTASSSRGSGIPGNISQNEQGNFSGTCKEPNSQQPLPCYPVSPLVFPWNPGWNNVTPVAASQHSSQPVSTANVNNQNPIQWCSTPMVAVPGFCPPNIALQFVPASYWGCMPVWTAGTGNMPLAASNGCLSPSSSTSNSCCSGNSSPTLGKHSRDPNFKEEAQSEKSILVPKTLRIDDPDEASKSPIWATLGIKLDQKDPISRTAIFKALETKADGKDHVLDGSHILEANPAALSRSHTFQESS